MKICQGLLMITAFAGLLKGITGEVNCNAGAEGKCVYDDMWFFNRETSKCERLDGFLTCQKSAWLYRSKKRCNRMCKGTETPIGPACEQPLPVMCKLPAQVAWYYNQTTQQCEKFNWAACGGANNFPTKQECSQMCGGPETTIGPIGPPCEQPLPVMCKLPARVAWYYNQMTQQCETFNWAACGGANNFPTKQDCSQMCGGTEDVCSLPRVNGPCRAMLPRWYYSTDTKKCESFRYGGCRGNANNFGSEEQCKEKCMLLEAGPVGSFNH